jgi:uncharacterized damage-inducible protein DinB
MDERTRLLREFDDARSRLLAAVEGLSEEDFTRPLGADAWTPEDLLNHIAAWDEYAAAIVRDLTAGRRSNVSVGDTDEWNARVTATRRGHSLAETLAALQAARAAFHAALGDAPDSLWDILAANVQGRAEHDTEHANELRALRDRSADHRPHRR